MSEPAAPPVAEVASPLRIQRVTLNDFRAFPGPAPVAFDLDGKNLLVYGENGAGKSSLFHALRDFFSTESANSMAKRMAAQKNIFSDLPLEQCAVSVAIEGYQGVRLFKGSSEWTSQAHPATRPPSVLREGGGPRKMVFLGPDGFEQVTEGYGRAKGELLRSSITAET